MTNIRRPIRVLIRLMSTRKRLMTLVVLQGLLIWGRLSYFNTPNDYVIRLIHEIPTQRGITLLELVFCVFPYVTFILLIDMDVDQLAPWVLNRMRGYSAWLISKLAAVFVSAVGFWLMYSILSIGAFGIAHSADWYIAQNHMSGLGISFLVHVVSTMVVYSTFSLVHFWQTDKTVAYSVVLGLCGIYVMVISLAPAIFNWLSPVQFVILTGQDNWQTGGTFLFVGACKVVAAQVLLTELFKRNGGEIS